MKDDEVKVKSKYKGKYFIVFYDKTGEQLLYMFDNARDILRFQGKPITRQNVNHVNVRLYRALKTDTHFVTFLTGEVMRVYIFSDEEDEDDI